MYFHYTLAFVSRKCNEIIKIFKDSGALLEGHFILRSGLHSTHYFQCAQVCQHLEKVTRLAELMLPKLIRFGATTVVAPAMGGLVIGQEVARQLGLRFVFLEKVNDRLALRRSFKFYADEKVLIIEDVITRGGRVIEALELCRTHGAVPVAISMIVDRSKGETKFDVPHYSLAQLNFPTYTESELPVELQNTKAVKPGS